VAIRFAIEDDLRFIAHHDTMRMFERALSRAQLPIKYSAGFNPRPKLSLPIPRAVGIASEAELLLVEFAQPIEPHEVRQRLSAQMPGGVKLVEAWRMEQKRSPRPMEVGYILDLPAEQAEKTAAALAQLLKAETFSIERSRSASHRPQTVDLRIFLADASLDACRLQWVFYVTPQGSARPAEMLSAIGLDPEEYLHRVRRSFVRWEGLQPADEITGSRPFRSARDIGQ